MSESFLSSAGPASAFAESFLGADSPIPLSPQHIDGPRADHLAWDGAVEASTAMQHLLDQHRDWTAFPALLQDVFSSFYKMDPQLRDSDLVEDKTRANRPYVEQILQEPATRATRSQTLWDELASAVATLAAGHKLAEQIAQNDDLNQAMQNNTPPPPGAEGALAKAGRRAMQKAGKQAEALQSQMMSWGIDKSQLTQTSWQDRWALAQQLVSPHFRQLADLIGRLRNLARVRQGGALRHLRDEIYQVATGSDLSRILPVELGALSDPIRQWDFGRRLVEGQLMQYDVKPIHREGRGPVLCAIDASGSMGGSTLAWASAVGLALLDTAQRQKRDFAAVFFDTKILTEFLAVKGQMGPADLVRFMSVGTGGGTDFQPPLAWALEQLHTARFKTADITFITDGVCRLPRDFLNTLQEKKRQWGFRIFAILIGGTASEIETWSDRVWALSGRPDDDAAGAMFAELVAR